MTERNATSVRLILQKSKFAAQLRREFGDPAAMTDEQATAMQKRNYELREQSQSQPKKQWHAAPDGTPCCCTADDRRYGCGCR